MNLNDCTLEELAGLRAATAQRLRRIDAGDTEPGPGEEERLRRQLSEIEARMDAMNGQGTLF